MEYTTVVSASCSQCAGRPKPPFTALRKCGGCSINQYCSVDCQKAEWPSHKKMCLQAQAFQARRKANPDGSCDPADFAAWVGRYAFNIKEACQQAFNLHDRASRSRCNNEFFLFTAEYDEKLAEPFTVSPDVHALPMRVCEQLFPKALTGMDAPALLAEMKAEPLGQQHDRTVLGLLRCGGAVMMESFYFMDEGLDRLVPDPNWRKSLTDRIVRKERYADPTLVPAGGHMMVEPLEEDIQ